MNHLNSDGENMTKHPPDTAREAADKLAKFLGIEPDADNVLGLVELAERTIEVAECGKRLNEDKFRHLEAYRKAADEDKARIASLAQQLAAKEREHRYFVDNVTNRFMRDTLVVLAGAVPTPEKGYIEDGGMSQLLADIKRLRKDRDAAERRAAEAEAELARTKSFHGDLIAQMSEPLSSAERKGEQNAG